MPIIIESNRLKLHFCYTRTFTARTISTARETVTEMLHVSTFLLLSNNRILPLCSLQNAYKQIRKSNADRFREAEQDKLSHRQYL